MQKIKQLFLFSLLALLAGCGYKGQTIFFWEKQDVGPVWFAKEHNECLAEADWWPWQAPAPGQHDSSSSYNFSSVISPALYLPIASNDPLINVVVS